MVVTVYKPLRHLESQKPSEPAEVTGRYRVVGPFPVHGVKPGECGEMTMPEDRERYLVDLVGCLEKVPEYEVPRFRTARKNRPEKAVTTTEQE
jgi:hypothetical protein